MATMSNSTKKPAKKTRAKPKAASKPGRPKKTGDDAARVGSAIRRLRRERKIKQLDLAHLVGMQPAQLCNTEKGKNLPSLRTLCRIGEALGVTVNDLVYPRNLNDPHVRSLANAADSIAQSADGKPAEVAEALETSGIALATPLGSDQKAEALVKEVVDELHLRIADYIALESMCGIAKHASIPLSLAFSIDDAGAERLAGLVRMHCGIGTAVVLDYIEMLESNGLRVMFTDKMPNGIDSLSFYDASNNNAFIFLSESISAERQLFRAMVELANIYLFTRDGFRSYDADANRHFANRFAAVMLMPRSAVETTVLQLGIQPEQWSYEMLLRIKSRFGVSAEAFAYRLDELGLIPHDGAVVNGILRQIKKHYAETGNSEPGEAYRKISHNTRFHDLLLSAKLYKENAPEVKKIEERINSNYADGGKKAAKPKKGKAKTSAKK